MGGYLNAAADIAFDTYGFSYLIIETDVGTDGIGQVGFLYRFG